MDAAQRLQPKLRMVLNGSDRVNAIRAEHCAALASEVSEEEVPFVRGQGAVPVTKRVITEVRGKLGGQVAQQSKVNVFVRLTDIGVDQVSAVTNAPADVWAAVTSSAGEGALSDRASGVIRKLDMATATIDLRTLRKLQTEGVPGVAFVEMGEPLESPTPTDITKKSEPTLVLRKIGDGRVHHFGRDVLIGIVDVQGFDFAHADFLTADRQGTRFVAIWDQGGNARPHPSERERLSSVLPFRRAAFDYGAEFLKRDLDTAIAHRANSPGSLPPQFLERQSQTEAGSHGTHVASIAAGNRGVCREARIAAVLIALPEEDLDRRRSFYDSTRLAHAIDYLLAVGDELGLPVAINVSLGTNGHAHDGSSTLNRWVDAAMSNPGRAVVVAAGNAGQEEPEFEGDIGYTMGRIHTSGRVPAKGLATVVEWIVVGNSILDLSENEMEVWYRSQDRLAVTIWTPSGHKVGPVAPGQFIENRQLPGGSFISIYNELYHPANGENYIAAYLSPFFGSSGVIGVPAGVWRVRLEGLDIRDGRFHAWIERDDPRRLGRSGNRDEWVFPSFFAKRSFVDTSTVSSLACGQRIISVSNLDEARGRIHHTSSQGPTRDERLKPDLAAPGTQIVAADGFQRDPNAWVAMTGTSMAAPYVTGVVGLMLSAKRDLTAAQIEGILRRTAVPLPGIDYRWQDNSGFGVIDPQACLDEAIKVSQRTDLTARR